MQAEALFNRRISMSANAFAELVAWAVPFPVSGSSHGYKYRLAFIVKGKCVLRYDNEAGKGDHIHREELETPYIFTGIDQLVADFLNDVKAWRNEHSDY